MPQTLITSATSALAYRVKNKLAHDVLLGDHAELPDFMLKQGNMIILPNPASSSYAHQMLTLCLDHDVDTIYLLEELEASLVAEARQLFSEFNITIIMPDEIQ